MRFNDYNQRPLNNKTVHFSALCVCMELLAPPYECHGKNPESQQKWRLRENMEEIIVRQ